MSADNLIDKLVLARLERLGVAPADVCTDAVFLRRAYLDVIGTLPTAQEARGFLAAKDPNKRSALIDRLLARDEFAGYWAMKWSDLLRVKAEFPINLWPNAAQAYHRWIRTSLQENMPYDRFVRELLTASGSNFRVPPANFYRAIQGRRPEAIAAAVALTFMGTRIENWPKERQAGLAAFFSQVGYKYTGEWKEEIVFNDFATAATQPADAGWQAKAAFPDGARPQAADDRDPRAVFADWLIEPKNPWFARNIVNRVWCWLLGRGIIHEPDDIRLDDYYKNPPSNPELLAYLERELVGSRYDLKHIYRLILNSKTYQFSSIPKSDAPGPERLRSRQAGEQAGGATTQAGNEEVRDRSEAVTNFACYPLRRLDAEVLIDALCQITGTTERYSSAIPEPFTFIPENLRSIELPDGSITSTFLELFGRPPRDSGLESERNNRINDAQRLYLLNSSHIGAKIEQGGKLAAILRPRNNPRDTVTELYLTILSRFPTDDELKIAAGYIEAGPNRGRPGAVDVAWALLNSAEFLYRH